MFPGVPCTAFVQGETLRGLDADGSDNLEWSEDARGWVTQYWKMIFPAQLKWRDLVNIAGIELRH